MLWKVVLIVNFVSLLPDAAGMGRSRRRERKSREITTFSVGEKCPFPCSCPVTDRDCTDCGECPRQAGEPCSEDEPCDARKSLVCKYLHGDSDGICRETTGVPCVVYNKTYDHGETFDLDCRTRCVCQNGTYGCSSLCPQEHISPKGSCQHPRLVELPGQCCREWMCDSQKAEQPSSCRPFFTSWSECSSSCGAGLSTRRSNINPRCSPELETRLCQVRRCQDPPMILKQKRQHHLRRGHECKATHRLSTSVFIRFGPCRSKKKFRPKFCGSCPTPNTTCKPSLSTTVKVEFMCDGIPPSEDISEYLPEYLEAEEDLWSEDGFAGTNELKKLTVLFQWVLKCSCETETLIPTLTTGEVILHRVHRTAAP
ncbi:CCN family member 1 isoform X1 [Coccinella septempunctata]|uniref:CCN family member 1 isoform X1 n=1 Tax=Coccinella septempunctata TaxID=41139 RepID=UPI001D07CDBB|nr:CCN family member 1 isoform X1 [Coccinella septempunctata]